MIILIQCKDKIGLVSAISGELSLRGINIISMREFVNTSHNRFFVRIEATQQGDIMSLKDSLAKTLPPNALIQVNPLPEKKIVVLVTKEHHCLSDILIRNHFKTLGATVQCVIGNHETLATLCDKFDVPFHHVSHEHVDKPEFEQQMHQIISRYNPDYLVLAKFMRILSPEFVARFPLQIINIHHSFLPAFIGANPYRQAYERGVKMIGATAHFVTNDLDEGPIIAQQIINVNHSYGVTDMMRSGKEIETAVLAKALHLVMEDRVMVDGNKTVVFE